MSRRDGTPSRSGPSGAITDAARSRPAIRLTLAPETIEGLATLAEHAKVSRSRVIDSLVAEAIQRGGPVAGDVVIVDAPPVEHVPTIVEPPPPEDPDAPYLHASAVVRGGALSEWWKK